MAELKPCGTYAAARRHQRKGEPVCDLCKVAVTKHNREQRARRRAVAVEKVQAPVEPSATAGEVGVLDPEVELRAQYDLLGRHLLEAPPQSVAAISRERRAILEQLTADKPVEASTGGVFDELAQRRKSRRAKA